MFVNIPLNLGYNFDLMENLLNFYFLMMVLSILRLLINYDLPWSVGKYAQRIGRVHRIGQHNPVLVYNLIATKTIDDHIRKLLLKKQALADKFLGGFSMEEIREILV